MTETRVLTRHDLVVLDMICGTAERTAKVARAFDNGDVVYGTARSVGDENGRFLRANEDVRDGFLRVTARSGFDHFWAIEALMTEASKGNFCEYDWSNLS